MSSFKVHFSRSLPRRGDPWIGVDAKSFYAQSNQTYDTLCAKMEECLPLLKKTRYSTYWQDNGDFISVTSDVDVWHAINRMSSIPKTIEFFVVYTEIVSHTVKTITKRCHQCSKMVSDESSMFCLKCQGYYLCNNCVALGVHHEHGLYRVIG